MVHDLFYIYQNCNFKYPKTAINHYQINILEKKNLLEVKIFDKNEINNMQKLLV
jgi:hypothetical protein